MPQWILASPNLRFRMQSRHLNNNLAWFYLNGLDVIFRPRKKLGGCCGKLNHSLACCEMLKRRCEICVMRAVAACGWSRRCRSMVGKICAGSGDCHASVQPQPAGGRSSGSPQRHDLVTACRDIGARTSIEILARAQKRMWARVTIYAGDWDAVASE